MTLVGDGDGACGEGSVGFEEEMEPLDGVNMQGCEDFGSCRCELLSGFVRRVIAGCEEFDDIFPC